MRLLHVHKFEFQQFHTNPPPYAILSHRWSQYEPSRADIELEQDIVRRRSTKVYAFAQYVKTQFAHLEWIWVDSCCINQDSAGELSEGVNCMFDWYERAAVCIAYLFDVDEHTNRDSFSASVWFTRGWTLQELVAPRVVIFVSTNWQVIGHKGNPRYLQHDTDVGSNLESILAKKTGIPLKVLQDFSNSDGIDDVEKMHWMNGRETLREEDLSYALFGIFKVSPGANYGEKKEGAERRLLIAIEQKRRLDTGDLAGGTDQAVIAHSIPYLRDPGFISRTEMLEMQNKLAVPGARVALVGLGGLGKTQLAIEHCHQVMKIGGRHVLWIHSSNAARFDQDMHKLAEDLAIPGSQTRGVDVFSLVRVWLNNSSRKWLVVLDSADEADFLFVAPHSEGQVGTKLRIDYFPVCSHGTILMTTRRMTAAERIAPTQNIIMLQADQELGLALVYSKLEVGNETRESHDRLAASLEYMPLAIAQAAAYLNKRRPRISIENYLERLNSETDKLTTSLLEISSPELGRDRLEGQHSILRSWQISFEHIYNTRQSAANLLSLMSFFDCQGIPETLLKPSSSEGYEETWSDEEDNNAQQSRQYDETFEAFEMDIDMLRDYFLISIAQSGDKFEMHRLVQYSARLWLQKENRHETWEASSLERLDMAFPADLTTYETWHTCRALYPHAKLTLHHHSDHLRASTTLASVLHKVGSFAFAQGYYSDAVRAMEQAKSIREDVLGGSHVHTFDSVRMLGVIFRAQGKYAQAEEMSNRAVLGSINAFGRDHPATLASIHEFALLLVAQGRYGDAEKAHNLVLDNERRVHGDQHQLIASTKSNLAVVLRHQGRLVEAETFSRDALQNSESEAGLDYLSKLACLNNLALILRDLGRIDECEEISQRAATQCEMTLGSAHPDTLTSLYNLAMVWRDQGRYQEATKALKHMLTTQERVKGPEHPHSLAAASSLSTILLEQGKFIESEELCQRSLVAREQYLGKEHPDTLKSLANLAIIYISLDRLVDAETILRRVLDVSHRVLGGHHPHTLLSTKQLGGLLSRQGRHAQAETFIRKALEDCESTIGSEHPETLRCMRELSEILRVQQKYGEAESWSRRELLTMEKVLGMKHRATLISVGQLAKVLAYQGKLEEAEMLYQSQLAAAEQVYGREHPETLTCVNNLAQVLDVRRQYMRARDMSQRAVEGYEKLFGKNHPSTLILAGNLAQILLKCEDADVEQFYDCQENQDGESEKHLDSEKAEHETGGSIKSNEAEDDGTEKYVDCSND